MSDPEDHSLSGGVARGNPDRPRQVPGALEPWPEDDPVLAVIEAWRASRPATLPSVPSQAPPSPEHAASRRPKRHAWSAPQQEPATPQTSQTGVLGIPGLSANQASAMAPPVIEEPPRHVEPRPLRPGRAGRWGVTQTEAESALAAAGTPKPELSDEEAAWAQASTVSFHAITKADLAEREGEIAIDVKGLRKVFKGFVAVDGVSFSVPKGKIHALLGPNGAGKTTIVNMLSTLSRPDSGTAVVAGCEIQDDAPGVRRAIMLTGQFAALDLGLTGRENLVMFARLLGMKKVEAKQRAEELLQAFDLEAAANRKVLNYSGGMRRRIDIACGLVTMPEVVFLDEPTTGLDPRSRQDVWNLVEDLRDQGVTVLLTTQYLEEADTLADRIVVIDKGKVIAEGTSDELKDATGAAYCEVSPVHPAYMPRLKDALQGLLRSSDHDDAVPGTLAVPAPDGPATLSLVLKRAEAAGIPLADIALRRPTLDEVFMSLTGPSSGSEGDEVSS